jgi:hypothetical protein
MQVHVSYVSTYSNFNRIPLFLCALVTRLLVNPWKETAFELLLIWPLLFLQLHQSMRHYDSTFKFMKAKESSLYYPVNTRRE